MTPDGAAPVNPARIRHWHDTVQAMLAAGIKPPLSWGHVSKAVPASPDDHAYWASRFIAGKVIGSEIDPRTGEWVLEGDAAGVRMTGDGKLLSTATLPDGRTVETQIEEVSVGTADWTDGTGRLWKDAPVHLALTPLPVWVPEGGQPPFEPAPASQARFSFSTLLYRFATEGNMADDAPKKEPPEKKEGGAVETEGGAPPLKKVLDMLSKCGLTLPPDTTEENILERLYVACTAKEGDMGGTGNGEPPPVPKEEQAPVMLSTIRDPVMLALATRVAEDDKTRRLAKVEQLVTRGLPGNEAKKLREAASIVRFALSPDGKPVKDALDEQLSLLDRVLPPAGEFGRTYLGTTVAGAVEEVPPEESEGVKKHQKVADEVARSAGLPARRKRA